MSPGNLRHSWQAMALYSSIPFLSLIKTSSVIWFGAHPNPGWPHLNSITSPTSYSQIRSYSQGLRVRAWNIFWGDTVHSITSPKLYPCLSSLLIINFIPQNSHYSRGGTHIGLTPESIVPSWFASWFSHFLLTISLDTPTLHSTCLEWTWLVPLFVALISPTLTLPLVLL